MIASFSCLSTLARVCVLMRFRCLVREIGEYHKTTQFYLRPLFLEARALIYRLASPLDLQDGKRLLISAEITLPPFQENRL